MLPFTEAQLQYLCFELRRRGCFIVSHSPGGGKRGKRGPTGPQGATGPTGPPGATGPTGAGFAPSTTEGALIRADDSGGWVEEDSIIVDSSGNITTSGVVTADYVVPDTSSVDFQDAQGVPVTRASQDYDSGTSTWRQRFFNAVGVLQATLAVVTTTGALSYDGPVDLQAGVQINTASLVTSGPGPPVGGSDGDYFLRTDGDIDNSLYKRIGGTWTAFTATPSGTLTDSTLRWSGTDWVENVDVLADAGGNLSVTGVLSVGTTYLAPVGTTVDFEDAQGSPVTRAQFDYDDGTSTFRRRFYNASAVLQATWAVDTTDGSTTYDAPLDLQAGVRVNTASLLTSGLGAPSGGSDGDFFFRTDGDIDNSLYKRIGGTWTAFTATPSGTLTDSTLRWSGTDWVENTNFLVDSSGNITAASIAVSGDVTVSVGASVDFQDAQGSPVTRSQSDYDDGTSTWRQRFFNSIGVLQSTLAVDTTNGDLSYDGAVDFQAGVRVNTASTLTSGTGAPSGGSDGDVYFRDDGGIDSSLYVRLSGVWTPITTTGIGTTIGDLLYWDGSDWAILAPSTSGRNLVTQGAGFAPAWTTVVNSITSSDGSVTVGSGGGPTADLSVPLIAGTDEGDIANWDGSDWTSLAAGVSGQILQTQGVGVPPAWITAEVIAGGTVTDSTLRWSGTDWTENTVFRTTTGGAVDIVHNNAALTIGDYGGSPTQTFAKSDGGEGAIYWLNVDGTPSAGDFKQWVGLDEVLRIGKHDGVDWRVAVQINNDQDLLFGNGAQGALSTSWGNSGTPADVTHTNYVGASGIAGWYAHDGTNARQGGAFYGTQFDTFGVRVANADQIYVQDGSIYPVLDNDVSSGLTGKRWTGVFAYAATITNTLTLDADTGIVGLYFTDSADGDASLRYNVSGNLISFYVKGSTELFRMNDANGLTSYRNLLIDATSPTFTMGDGVTTGSPTAYILKGPSGFGNLRFMATDTSESDGDWLWQHASDSLLRLYSHDGTANRAVFDLDTASIGLLSGAQGSSTVTIGGSVNATDEAILVLASGNSGLPAVHFDDSNSRIQWSASGLVFQHFVEATQEFSVSVDAITMLSTVNGVVNVTGSLDAARYLRGQSLIADGDLGAGVASTTTVTNVTEASTSGALAIIDCALGLNGNNAGYLKFYVGTTAVYVPYFGVSA